MCLDSRGSFVSSVCCKWLCNLLVTWCFVTKVMASEIGQDELNAVATGVAGISMEDVPVPQSSKKSKSPVTVNFAEVVADNGDANASIRCGAKSKIPRPEVSFSGFQQYEYDHRRHSVSGNIPEDPSSVKSSHGKGGKSKKKGKGKSTLFDDIPRRFQDQSSSSSKSGTSNAASSSSSRCDTMDNISPYMPSKDQSLTYVYTDSENCPLHGTNDSLSTIFTGGSDPGPVTSSSSGYNVTNTPVLVSGQVKDSARHDSRKKIQQNKEKKKFFNSYMSIAEIQKGLKRGEVLEGVLRINHRNYEDAYISSPQAGQTDIYVGGIHDRNRALNGDVVAVKLKSPEHWKILNEAIDDFEAKNRPLFSSEQVENMNSAINSLRLTDSPLDSEHGENSSPAQSSEETKSFVNDNNIDQPIVNDKELIIDEFSLPPVNLDKDNNPEPAPVCGGWGTELPDSNVIWNLDDFRPQAHTVEILGLGKLKQDVDHFRNVEEHGKKSRNRSKRRRNKKNVANVDASEPNVSCTSDAVGKDSIIVSPEEILMDEEGRFIGMAENCPNFKDEHEYPSDSAVPPDQLSGCGISMCSDNSVASIDVDQYVEDLDFFKSQLDARNNNDDNEGNDLINVQHADLHPEELNDASLPNSPHDDSVKCELDDGKHEPGLSVEKPETIEKSENKNNSSMLNSDISPKESSVKPKKGFDRHTVQLADLDSEDLNDLSLPNCPHDDEEQGTKKRKRRPRRRGRKKKHELGLSIEKSETVGKSENKNNSSMLNSDISPKGSSVKPKNDVDLIKSQINVSDSKNFICDFNYFENSSVVAESDAKEFDKMNNMYGLGDASVKGVQSFNLGPSDDGKQVVSKQSRKKKDETDFTIETPAVDGINENSSESLKSVNKSSDKYNQDGGEIKSQSFTSNVDLNINNSICDENHVHGFNAQRNKLSHRKLRGLKYKFRNASVEDEVDKHLKISDDGKQVIVKKTSRKNREMGLHAKKPTRSNRSKVSKSIAGMSVKNSSRYTVNELMEHPSANKFLQRTAEVVYIIEKKHSRTAVGHLKVSSGVGEYALFSPNDSRMPRMLIHISNCPPEFLIRPQDYASMLIVARIVDWPETSKMAIGTLYRSLGEAGEIEPETDGMLLQYGVDFSDFPEDISEDLPTLPWNIPESEILKRRDCRDDCVFTIDPATARDLDDALSCTALGDGFYRVYVHIADVSYFVAAGSKLDKIAQDRSTSVYLVQKVIPMLPRVLCEQLCSLNPREDRLTFSVEWIMTEDGEIIEEWFGRTIIRSCAKLNYNHAQEMIECDENQMHVNDEWPAIDGKHSTWDVVRSVKMLQKIALKLRSRRFESGALVLDQVQLQFSLDQETGLPNAYSVYEQKDSNRLIEEFMLLANMAVAHCLCKAYPDHAFLRRHTEPQLNVMEKTTNMCSSLGMNIDYSSSHALQTSLSFYSGSDVYSKARYSVLSNLYSKPMNSAEYFCSGMVDESEYRHYALNVPLYTHFTSPIRRYPDMIVHRQLAAFLGISKAYNLKPVQLQKMATYCNDKKYAAKCVSELSSDMFLSTFVRECGPIEEKAIVMGVMDHSFDVLVYSMGAVKRVYCNRLPLQELKFSKISNVPQLSLTWNAIDGNQDCCRQTKQIITVFSIVDVVMFGIENEPLKYMAVLKRPSNPL